MSNIKVTIKDINTLRLEENAKIGDTIDLKSLHSVDDTFIIDAINQKKDEVYKQLLSNVRKENETAIELSLAKEKQLFEQEKNLLNNKLIELKNQLENQNKTHNQANEFLRKELNSSFELEKQRLLNEINSLKETHEQKVKNIELMTRQNLESIYKDKLNEKDLMIQEQRLKLESNLTKHQLSISETKQKYEEQIFNQQKEIENLKRERSLRNIKQIGEDLENWCNEQFKSISLYGFKTSTFEKDNTSIRYDGETKGTKGDYIFKVFNNNKHDILLTSAMVEMKSEALESETKKKNSDHYKKLNDDRMKKGLEYAILVSELEYNLESDAPIYVVDGYEKMYVVRPHFFITLLGVIESIGMKYADIITEKEAQRIEFKESLLILEEFENFKSEILDRSLKHIETQVLDIQKKTETIISSANSISSSVRVIVDTHLNTVKNKINTFSINKVLKHIDKI